MSEPWSGKEQISAVVAGGGVLSTALTIWAVTRVFYLRDFQIDTLSANLLTLAGLVGIATLVFGTWICWRRVGFWIFRFAAIVLGIIGVGAWPVMDYVVR
jgi:hypothetical protein